MAKSHQHAHKLKKLTYKSTGNSIFFCTLPDCNFKSDTKLTLGKRALCWRCGKEFLINEYSIRLTRPHCMDCTKNKNEKKEVSENVESVMKPQAADIVRNSVTSSVTTLRERLNKSFLSTPKDEEGDI